MGRGICACVHADVHLPLFSCKRITVLHTVNINETTICIYSICL